MSIRFEMTGVDDIKEKLERLAKPSKAKSIARKALRQGANIVRDSARAKSKSIDDPKTKDKIFRNIAVEGGKSKRKDEVKLKVGVKGGASFSNPTPPSGGGGDTRHWRWIEFGKTGVPAVPFMRPALAMNIENVINKFSQVFVNELDAELAKL